MSTRYQVEALLRPPVEFYPAIVATLAAGVMVAAPSIMVMPPPVAYGAAAVLFLGLAVPRFLQGWSVLSYQRNLKRLRPYAIKPRKILVSNRKLFLGRGFRWEQVHTQRLRDTQKPEVRKYVQPGRIYAWARRIEVSWERAFLLKHFARLFSADHWWNPVRPLPQTGGKPLLHAVEPNQESVFMDLGERVGHMLVLGTTRVGKTRLAELLITQDIHRGDVVIVFDPKGDADLLRRVYAEAKRAGRDDAFYAFHLGYPEISARYNAIGNFNRVTEVATRVANQLPDQGNSAAFKEFAWRFVNIIARALVALSRRPDYRQIRQHINDIEPLLVEYAEHHFTAAGPETWSKEVDLIAKRIDERNLPFAFKGRSRHSIALCEYAKEQGQYDPVLDGLISAFKYDRTYFDKIVSSVGPLMEKLTTGKVAELLSPDYFDIEDSRPIFDWRQVIRQRGIVYVGLDALSDMTVSSAVGNSMFADLVSVAGELYKFGRDAGLPDLDAPGPVVPISLHADEFNELIGDEFIPLVSKGGGAGLQITAYTQTLSDIEARTKDRAKAGQVVGNFNTLLMLRVKELRTAELLTNQVPMVDVQTFISVSGVSDSSSPSTGPHFTSRNEDRITTQQMPMISAADIVKLPKGQCFALLEGGQLWKVRLPLPDASDDLHMPSSLEAIADDMGQKYATNDHWYLGEEPWWNRASAAAPAEAAAPHPEDEASGPEPAPARAATAAPNPAPSEAAE